MSILQSKKLQTRILLGYTLPLGLLTLFAVIMGVAVKNTNDLSMEVERSNHVIDNIRDSVIHTSRIVRSVRGAALFPKEDVYVESYNTGVERLEETLTKMNNGDIKDPQQKENWQKLVKEIEMKQAESQEIMNLMKVGKVNEALPKIRELEMTSFDKVKDAMLQRETEIIEGFNSKEEFVLKLTMILILVGLFVGIAVTLFFGNMIAKAITEEVKTAVNDITASSNEIAATMEQQERTANLQAASVNETTTTMDELRASSHQSEEQAEAAAQAAQEVLQLADNGNQSVEETVATMIDLKNKVAAIADQIVRLSEQTNQIGNISSLVSDLSQQTNMLALNASVEAVRAGEHGKGFAVVAEEIRKLADQSRQSASNIGGLVSDIQNAINTTVMVTDEGTKTVNAGMNITERTANAFSGVLESINNVAMNNQQIVLNIRQQGKAVQQVLEAMDSINQGAQENAAGLSQVKVGTQQLSHTAKQLSSIV
ncbi:methyl-accepting chemotaxis protein [Geminocystis sp. NIES-3709]|uniref:methyl-accepting chemotaxis protein n=1 Tax=Geminocystis sp. NIES-3709 TaxID=1617448 RepID=UPI0005FC4006|nr:methyl-accepting chemotaxis protein [Geminocystis sp. NIES-3709]BAQ66040.1 methyl-accepting chemotaxis protein [Geminocystis sp. NIES-3709]